jgi:hypothetical protein
VTSVQRSVAVTSSIIGAFLLALTALSVPPAQAIAAVLVITLQAATGAIWWGRVRRGNVGPIEQAGMGLAIGTAAATISGALLGKALPGGIAWAVPTLITFACSVPFLVRRIRRAGRPRRPDASGPPLAPAVIALIAGGFLGVAGIAVNVLKYPLGWAGSVTSYHQDMFFFEALATSITRFGPGDTIFMAGSSIRYHWFTYAWAGQLSETIGAGPFVVLTRVLPLTALAGTVLIAIFWTQRLTKGKTRWAPTLAVVLLVFGGYLGATYGTILNFDSPSQQLATVWMLGLSVALLRATGPRLRNDKRRLREGAGLAVIALFAAAATGGKGSIGAVVIAAWAFAALIGSARRETWAPRAWAAFLAASAGAGLVYFLYVGGSAWGGGLVFGGLLNKASSVQGLNPTDARWGIALGTGILILAVIPRWAGLAWLLAVPSSRWKPVTLYSTGLALVGIVTLLLLSGSLNDVWFALAASAPLCVVSAAGISRATRSVTAQRGWRPSAPAIWAVAAGIGLSFVVMALWTFGPDSQPALRWAGPIVGLIGAVAIGLTLARHRAMRSNYAKGALALILLITVVTAMDARLLGIRASAFGVQGDGLRPTEFAPFLPFVESRDRTIVSAMNEDQVAVAEWLRANSGELDIVATNMTYTPIVPALTGRRSYISGLQYQAAYGRPAALDEMLMREWVSWNFIDAPNPDAALALCRAGVRWLWIDSTRTPTRSWEPFASVVLHEGDVMLAELNARDCPPA